MRYLKWQNLGISTPLALLLAGAMGAGYLLTKDKSLKSKNLSLLKDYKLVETSKKLRKSFNTRLVQGLRLTSGSLNLAANLLEPSPKKK